MTDLKKSLTDFMDRVWNNSDEHAIGELVSKDAQISGLEESALTGAADYASFHRMIHAQFRNIRLAVEHSVEQGEWIAARTRVTGIERTTGRKVSLQMHSMTRFVDGKMAEGHNLVDFISLFQQMKLLPDRTLDICLMGQSPALTQILLKRLFSAA